jgi:hypothetical protein
MILAVRQSDEQKRLNDLTKFQFIMAMMNIDYMAIKTLLNRESIFLGWMNAWQFSNWLKNKFKPIGDFPFHSSFNEKVCADICPGADMFEFEFSFVNGQQDLDSFLNTRFTDKEAFKSCSIIKISLALIFEEGKIVNVRIPKKGIDMAKIKRLQLEN